MTKAFGVAFTVGATIASSVNTAFSTIEQKIKNAKGQMSLAEKKARALQKPLNLQAEYAETARKLAESGNNDVKLRTELAKLGTQYKLAKANAEAYKVSVKDWRTEHEKAIQTLEHQRKVLSLQKEMKSEQGVRSNMRSKMTETVVPALAIAAPVAMAVQFESAMADVSKTIDGMRKPTGEFTDKYYEMEQVIKEMGRTIPLTHTELASLFAAGGQQGIGDVKGLQEFATMSAQMSVAFGMSQESAASAIGGYRASLGLSMDETRSMLDLMNQYANTSSATEADIAEVVKRVGGLGKIAGVSVKPMTALAATLTSMKVAPEVAATSIKNLLLAMTAGEAATGTQTTAFAKLGMSTVQLAKDMQNNAPQAILSVLEAIKKLPKEEQLSTMKSIFGSESLGAIGPMLGQLDLVIENMRIAGDETAYAGAMQKEFTVRNQTTAASLTTMKNRVSEVGINIGTTLLPALVQTLETIGPMATGFADYVAQNPAVIKTVLLASAGLIALKIAGSAVIYTTSLLRTAMFLGQKSLLVFNAALRITTLNQHLLGAATVKSTAIQTASVIRTGIVTTVYKLWAVAVGGVAIAQKVLNLAMSANPIGVVIRVVSLLVGSMVALYNTCEPVRSVFDAVFGFIGAKMAWVWDNLKSLYEGMKSVGNFFSFGGDDEENPDVPSEKKNRAALEKASGIDLGAGTLTPITPMAMPDMGSMQQAQAPMSMNAGGAGSHVNVGMNFTLNGISDEDFAKRVMQGITSKSDEFTRIISNIVDNEMRVAYGT